MLSQGRGQGEAPWGGRMWADGSIPEKLPIAWPMKDVILNPQPGRATSWRITAAMLILFYESQTCRRLGNILASAMTQGVCPEHLSH